MSEGGGVRGISCRVLRSRLVGGGIAAGLFCRPCAVVSWESRGGR